ncbi:sugar kinase [Streptomyces sp. CB02923]|uniref:ROK family transcriptional regulator n=1 Tax=Streptomyces sp. CB02923 TaxID=1718985 RepID=UPI0009406070|nr:ROK family transcriptional regulator [Streptomyces sp. CB02923]OKI01027.1 sugar kinase [Streptomyces sp. CB02923]
MRATGRRTVRDLRRDNRAVVLRQLYFDGPLSRQELVPVTGLSAGSISNVVGELADEGLVEEAGVVGSDGGRPRTLLRVAAGGAHLVGVDVGETRVRVELFDLSMRELARTEQVLGTPGDLPDATAAGTHGSGAGGAHDATRVVRLIARGVADVLRTAGTGAATVLGVGIGVPGIVDGAGDGAVVHGQAVGWDAVPLEAMLRACGPPLSDLPLFIDNGAKTLGRAEMWFGAGRGADNAVITLIGSGVGACVVADGTPYRGTASSAGEWGHTTMRVGGRRCRCGARGCLEAYVGAEALLERWRETGAGWGCETGGGCEVGGGCDAGGRPVGPGAGGGPDQEAALGRLLAAADEPATAALLAETAEYLGAGIADLVNLFNPERIVVAGWAGLLLAPRLLPSVRAASAAYALRHPYERTVIEPGRLGPEAVTIGAAALPLGRFLAFGGHRDAPPREDCQWSPVAFR